MLIGETGYVNWIGTNRLIASGSGGYYLMDVKGNALTDEVFEDHFSSDGILIVALKQDADGINSFGALNMDGVEVMPFKYGDIKVFNGYWAVGIVLTDGTAIHYDYSSINSDNYYLISEADIYNIASGVCLATLPREQYADAYAFGNYINIEDRTTQKSTTYDANFNVLGTDLTYSTDETYMPKSVQYFYHDGLTGLKDAEGNVILEPAYSIIYGFVDMDNYSLVETDEGKGLIDITGAQVVPPEYDRINASYYISVSSANTTNHTGYNSRGYFCVEKDGKLGYVTAGGKVTCELKYNVDAVENNGASATYKDAEGKTHIIAGDGVESVAEGYASVRPANYGSGVYYIVTDENNHYGLIDFHCNEVLPCEFENIELSWDGEYVLAATEYLEQYAIYGLIYPN